jgi:hypothetical protein
MINLPREAFKRAYSWFRSRLEESVAAEDYLFNQMSSFYEKESVCEV